MLLSFPVLLAFSILYGLRYTLVNLPCKAAGGVLDFSLLILVTLFGFVGILIPCVSMSHVLRIMVISSIHEVRFYLGLAVYFLGSEATLPPSRLDVFAEIKNDSLMLFVLHSFCRA